MESPNNSKETATLVPESKLTRQGKANIIATTKATPHHPQGGGVGGGWRRGVAVLDFILRLCALVAALAAAATMGTTDQSLPFFSQFFQFQASYDDLPAFSYALSPFLKILPSYLLLYHVQLCMYTFARDIIKTFI